MREETLQLATRAMTQHEQETKLFNVAENLRHVTTERKYSGDSPIYCTLDILLSLTVKNSRRPSRDL